MDEPPKPTLSDVYLIPTRPTKSRRSRLNCTTPDPSTSSKTHLPSIDPPDNKPTKLN